MITFTEIPDTNIVEFTIDGAIAAEDFDRVIPQFVAAAQKHNSLRLLKQIKNIDKIDPAGFGQQMGDVFAHLGDITHAAIVADKKWEPAVSQMGTVYPFEVKFFELSELEAAREWLRTAG